MAYVGVPERGGGEFGAVGVAGVTRVGDLIPEVLDSGARGSEAVSKEYRVRSPTNSERLNRSLVELGLAAFKIHVLLWKWRGAPARGTLPRFTIHSLARFCGLSRPTVRVGLNELVVKGWIERLPYNKHHKNSLYRLVAIRKVPAPAEAV